MNNITSTNINSFCRTCLNKLQKYDCTITMNGMYNVHESQELSQWIFNCLPVPRPKDNKCLPKFVCVDCYQMLHCFDEFRAIAIRSMRTLSEILGLAEDGEEKLTTDLLEIPTEGKMQQRKTSTFGQAKESYTDNQDNDDKCLVMRSIMRSELFEPEINIVEQKSPFRTHNFGDTRIPAVSISNCKVLHAVDTLDINNYKSMKCQCKECKQIFANQENLDAHIRTHQGLKQFQCQKCYRTFKKVYYFERHMERVHSECVKKNDDSDVSNYSNELRIAKKKKAKRASKTNVTKTKKTSTMGTTSGKSIYECDECNRTFANKVAHSTHMRTHLGLRPYSCTKCAKSYARAYNMRQHMITAHTEKVEAIVFKATNCGKSVHQKCLATK